MPRDPALQPSAVFRSRLRHPVSRTPCRASPFRVQAKRSYTTPLGTAYTINASQEVILSAGAINTPLILMLSGIGPSAQLTAQGISVVLNAPNVGQGLQVSHLARIHLNRSRQNHFGLSLSRIIQSLLSNGRFRPPTPTIIFTVTLRPTMRRSPSGSPINSIPVRSRSTNRRRASADFLVREGPVRSMYSGEPFIEIELMHIGGIRIFRWGTVSAQPGHGVVSPDPSL